MALWKHHVRRLLRASPPDCATSRPNPHVQHAHAWPTQHIPGGTKPYRATGYCTSLHCTVTSPPLWPGACPGYASPTNGPPRPPSAQVRVVLVFMRWYVRHRRAKPPRAHAAGLVFCAHVRHLQLVLTIDSGGARPPAPP